MISKLKRIFFNSQGQKETMLKNFAWLGASQIGSRLIRSAITIYAARALGTSGYGVLSYAMGLTAFFIFFKNIGVDAILTREVAHRPLERDRLFATSFWMEVGLLVITACLLLFVAPVFSHIPEAIILIPVLTVMIVADDMKDLLVAFFRGIEKMEWEALVVIATNIAVVVFGFGALLISATPLYLALAYAASSVFGVFLAGGIIFTRHIRGFFGNFDKNLVMPILKSAWPIAVGGLGGIFIYNVDIVMLGFWRTVDDVGVYAAVQKIVGILSVIPALVGTATFPVFSRLAHSHDLVRMRQAIESVLRLLLLFSIPLVLGGIVLAAPLLGFIFSPAYTSGASAMAVLLISILTTFPLTILFNFIFAHDKQRKAILNPVITSLTNAILNFLLIPQLGMIGASIATLISGFVFAFLTLRVCFKIEHFSIWKGLPKILSAAIPMAIFAWLIEILGLPVLLNIILSAGLYFLILKFLKEEALEEVLLLLRPSKAAS